MLRQPVYATNSAIPNYAKVVTDEESPHRTRGLGLWQLIEHPIELDKLREHPSRTLPHRGKQRFHEVTARLVVTLTGLNVDLRFEIAPPSFRESDGKLSDIWPTLKRTEC